MRVRRAQSVPACVIAFLLVACGGEGGTDPVRGDTDGAAGPDSPGPAAAGASGDGDGDGDGARGDGDGDGDDAAVSPTRVHLLAVPEADLVAACGLWAVAYCEKLEQCNYGGFFNMGYCTHDAAGECHRMAGRPGSALTLDVLATCGASLADKECTKFAAEAVMEFDREKPPYVQRCIERSAGTLDNAELCTLSDQCRSGICDPFRSASGQDCNRCVENLLAPLNLGSESAAPLPEARSEGDPAVDGECRNFLLEPIDGICRLRPGDETYNNCGCPEGRRCRGWEPWYGSVEDAVACVQEGTCACAEVVETGETCEGTTYGYFDTDRVCPMSAYCKMGTEPAGMLDWSGRCEPSPNFSDEPVARELDFYGTSQACIDEVLGPEDRRYSSPSPTNTIPHCVAELERDPDYPGANVGELTLSRELDTAHACLIHRFQGRASCPYGQTGSGGGCTTPDATPVEGPVLPQLLARRSDLDDLNTIIDEGPPPSTYRACRCDGEELTAEYCTCREGFTCQRLTEDHNGLGWASFCVFDGTEALDDEALANGPTCDLALLNCGPP